MKMRRKAIFILVLLALSFSFVPGIMAQSKVAVVANSIDIGMNPELVSLIRKNNLMVDYFGVRDSGYATYDYIIILGGPDSEEHTGDLSRRILSETDQNTLRNGNYKLMYETSDFFKMKQNVFVLAGSDRDYTKMAVDQYLSQVISRITNQPITSATYKTLTATQLKQLIDSKETIYLVDVRTEEQFAESHIPGAVNIPYNKLGVQISQIPRDKKVVLYCNTGQKSVSGAQFLADRNFDNVYAVTDGYSVYYNIAK
ncbi:MAG: molybdopterin biosynthesis-like protein MoeZ [Candidatus Methanofastidiosum methylothiophilum]|uniref:Molybdopterin biosynthesis-like protein MoeZ n=1 Tax=Candidatus Methanofastidiosum methylothiophilum TaxID=1705564 RepID=A0A150IHQ0_9EURY|nr:MAG: molybdopterin biosynthesis-like protein MoeZ [Candidatus Methanofastidiosum methylthiophilus]KYC46833.1 MAG: molybdopterin biosynthesis-like protein MoeZ [Candidatus Methanofastidiosum methylthiophilus]KYC48924.1 MAG: molybdopterin biosynthesis-like protein MoeZ [Candidatus Methanofastidiosum methylthiophilus]